MASRLPADQKISRATTKFALRKALEPIVPAHVLNRPKLGFPVPFGRWAKDRFAAMLRETILGARARSRGLFDHGPIEKMVGEHEVGAVNHADRLWLLLNLELWQRTFLDGEEPAAVPRPGSIEYSRPPQRWGRFRTFAGISRRWTPAWTSV